MPMPLSVTVKISRTRPRPAGSAPAVKTTRAALGELHRVVDEVFQRRAQPQRVAGHHRRQIGRDGDLGLDAFVAGARGERMTDRFGQPPRRERLVPQA